MLTEALRACPSPSAARIVLRVTPDAERWLKSGHPWLYDQAIRTQRGEGRPGDLAVVFDARRKFLAIGLYDPTSPIRVRVLLHRRPATIDRNWYARRLAESVQRRAPLARSRHTNGYRLVHGENDGLPGLVIDRYAETLVVKLYTVAWVPHLRDIVDGCLEAQPAQRVILRLARTIQDHPEFLAELRDGIRLIGSPLHGPLIFLENGLRFEVDPVRGHKTGWFLDQRENRASVERMTDGASVLDAFAYTGGFSVYAAKGGAREVTSLDVSQPALEVARRNMMRNQHYRTVARVIHRVLHGDVFEKLRELARLRRRFDVVILDPPTFAKTQGETRRAILTYARMTQLGLGVLRPGGLLVASSCSSHVSAGQFFDTVRRAAHQVGRRLKEIERSGHPLDHPIGFPEGAYLKCFFAVAEESKSRRR